MEGGLGVSFQEFYINSWVEDDKLVDDCEVGREIEGKLGEYGNMEINRRKYLKMERIVNYVNLR